jgi:hypothetical protein
MSNCVVGHVNSGVRQRLYQELGVPRELGAKTCGARASPLVEPLKGLFKLLLGLLIVTIEGCGLDVIHNEILPVFFSIGEEPLVAESNDAFISSTRYDFTFRLVVWASQTKIHKVLLDDGFSFLNLEATS